MPRKHIRIPLRPTFRGYTNADGTRRADAPDPWPFGTVKPPTEKEKKLTSIYGPGGSFWRR